ncbi:MAG: trypsin-like serine protease [Proteobacteria bacterium]|nr:trypsin-like serine protease [Pseudomonadota bacterium]
MKAYALYALCKLNIKTSIQLCILIPLLSACGLNTKAPVYKPRKQCTAPSINHFNLIGGNTELLEYPATFVVGMYLEDNSLKASCTGTFVGTDRLVTSAHCVADSSEKISSIGFASTYAGLKAADVIRTESWAIHPSYIARNPDMNEATKNDVMFAFFPPGTYTQKPFAKFATKRAGANDEITLLGYGSTSIDPNDIDKTFNVGTRKLGKSTIDAIYPPGGDAIFWSKIANADLAGSKPGIGHGDSGGPIYNTAGEITGLMRGFSIDPKEQQPILHSWAVNVNYKPIADFINEQMNYKTPEQLAAPNPETQTSAPVETAKPNNLEPEAKPAAQKANPVTETKTCP